jgi:hypothetical protein
MSPPPDSTGSMYSRAALISPSYTIMMTTPRSKNGEPSRWVPPPFPLAPFGLPVPNRGHERGLKIRNATEYRLPVFPYLMAAAEATVGMGWLHTLVVG